MSEGVAGTNLKVLLELGGAFAGLKEDATDPLPWPVPCGVEVSARVVWLLSRARTSSVKPTQACLRSARLLSRLTWCMDTSNGGLPYVARRGIHGPTSPGVPSFYVGHTSLFAALRAKSEAWSGRRALV
jgi:hypothetical protein